MEIEVSLTELDEAVLMLLDIDYTYEGGILSIDDYDVAALKEAAENGDTDGWFYDEHQVKIDDLLRVAADNSGCSVGALIASFGMFKGREFNPDAVQLVWEGEDDELDGLEPLPDEVSVDLDFENVSEDDVESAIEDNYEANIESYEEIFDDGDGSYTMTGIVWSDRWDGQPVDGRSGYDSDEYPSLGEIQEALATFAVEETAWKILGVIEG